jgi:hypothetical protein
LVLLSLFEYSNGYWIDPNSCAQYGAYIAQKMPNVIAFLRTANQQMANFGGQGQNDNVFNLANLLFDGENGNAKRSDPGSGSGSDLDLVEEAKGKYCGQRYTDCFDQKANLYIRTLRRNCHIRCTNRFGRPRSHSHILQHGQVIAGDGITFINSR